MGAQENFYESLDFRYAEVGTAMQIIDRMNPGRVKFSIPVLTPNLNTSTTSTNKIVQKDKSNLVNDNPDPVDVSNIEIANFLYVEIPLELCALPGAYHNITGQFTGYEADAGIGECSIHGNFRINGTARITGTLKFVGTVGGSCVEGGPVSGASFNSSGGITGSTSIEGVGSLIGTVVSEANRNTTAIQSIQGSLGTVLNNKSRYIPLYSKWLIIFIGGDIACPVVVCRLPNDAGVPVTETEEIEYEEIDQNKYIEKYPDLDLENFVIDTPNFDIDIGN